MALDDHPHIARLVQRELEAAAHEVITAADGEEALQRIHEERSLLVVLDVTMPQKDNFEVLRTVKSDPITQNTVVIMLTARDKDAEMTRGLKLGADWYLSKPFPPGDIAAVARRFLAGTGP